MLFGESFIEKEKYHGRQIKIILKFYSVYLKNILLKDHFFENEENVMLIGGPVL